MTTQRSHSGAVWLLGLTQIVGYGTLYYSFATLSADMAADFGVTADWIFGAFSVALLTASLAAPTAGRLADRYGAASLMAGGSALTALFVALTAIAPEKYTFAAVLVATQVTASTVFYSAAFVALVQSGTPRPALAITHLTLIAGFASTIFWPLTGFMHTHLDWRTIYLLFAAANLLVCAPAHVFLARGQRASGPTRTEDVSASPPALFPQGAQRRAAFVFMLLGFALLSLALYGVLGVMVPTLDALGLGASSLWIAGLFGPAQVAIRLLSLLFGSRMRQANLAVVSCMLTAGGLAALAIAPTPAGAVAFILLFGMGSGLHSIVSGTLPLELFGRAGYGAVLGWATAARQVMSSGAPFAFALALSRFSPQIALWSVFVAAMGSAVAFGAVALMRPQLR